MVLWFFKRIKISVSFSFFFWGLGYFFPYLSLQKWCLSSLCAFCWTRIGLQYGVYQCYFTPKVVFLFVCFFSLKGPIDCDSLEADVSLSCSKAQEKILNTWYQRVIGLFSQKALTGSKLRLVDSFYNSVAVLVSNQVKCFCDNWNLGNLNQSVG